MLESVTGERPHLEDDAIVELIEGHADAATRAEIEAHAASCSTCRDLLAAPPVRRRRMAAIITAAVVAGGGALSVFAITREAASPARAPNPVPCELTLPAIIDAPRTAGPILASRELEAAGDDQLGSSVVAATWCASREVAVVVTAYGRIATVDPVGAVTTLATIPAPQPSLARSISGPATMPPVGSAVVCLSSGRLVGVIWGTPFALDGTTVRSVRAPPPDVLDAVALGESARWLTPGAVWEWTGDAAPRKLRTTCAHPLRLSPDGERVACVREGRVFVDDGTSIIDGPIGGNATWSHDGHALYTSSSGVIRRWMIGGAGDGDILATDTAPIEVGPWLVTKKGSELGLQWIGAAPARPVPTIDLGFAGSLASIVTAFSSTAVVLAYGSQGIRVVAIDRPAAAFSPDRHLASIAALAFSSDGTSLVTAGMDRRLIVHHRGTRHLVGELADLPTPDSALVWRSDGTIVLGGERMTGSWDVDGHYAAWRIEGTSGPVTGTDDLVRFQVRDGISAITPEGARAATLYPGPLPRGVAMVMLDRTRRFALVRALTDLAEVIDLTTGKTTFTVTVRGKTAQRVALVAGGSIVVADTNGQIFEVSSKGVVPLFKLQEPITALAASPTDTRIAIGAGREVIVFDLDRKLETGRANVDSTVTALAWSRDGHRLAAAAASTELTIWEP